MNANGCQSFLAVTELLAVGALCGAYGKPLNACFYPFPVFLGL